MERRPTRAGIALCLCLGPWTLVSGACRGQAGPRAVAGALDLTGWDFEARGPTLLVGEWVFRYGRLDGPEALPREHRPGPPFIEVPGSWNEAGRAGEGHATHALRVQLASPPPRELALALGEAHSAERVYVNGRLVLRGGHVSPRGDDEIADPAPRQVRFAVEAPVLDLVVETSNHFHFEGGPVHAPRLGLPEQLEARRNAQAAADFAILGALSVLSLYYAILYLARPERSHALFALLTALVVLRVAVTRWHLNAALPLTPGAQLRLDYLTLFLPPAVYYALLFALFPKDASRRVLRAALGFALIGLASLLLPPRIFTHLREAGIAAGLSVVALALVLAGRAALAGREGARLVTASCGVGLLLALHDAASRLRLIEESAERLPLAVAILLVSHALVLGLRLGRALETSVGLTGELRDMNLGLERRIRERTAELERLATTDPLTGLSNRREVQRLADVERARAVRHGYALSVLVVDADNFKSINDTHGHVAGDHALRAMAGELLGLVRGHDLLGRWGGGEFVLVLPHLDSQAALAAGERVRQRLGALQIPVPEGSPLRVTVSVGVAVAGPNEVFEQTLRRADNALFRAKESGRNRVSVDPG